MRVPLHEYKSRGGALVLMAALAVMPAVAQNAYRPLFDWPATRGLQIDSVTVSSTSFTSGDLRSLPVQTGADTMVMGSTSVSWNRSRERSAIHFGYQPSYMSYVRFPDYNGWNHSLSFTAGRLITPRFRLETGLTGSYAATNQLLFTPTALQRAADAPGSFEDLASAVLRSPVTSDQLAAQTAGAGVSATPGELALFGSTVLSSSVYMTATYSPSSRTNVMASFTGTRMQPLSSGGGQNRPLLMNSTMGVARVMISRSVSTRTQAGISLDESRTVSPFQDAWRTMTTAFVGRSMSRRWLIQLQGGAGVLQPVRSQFAAKTRAEYQGGASVVYRERAHTVMLSALRGVGDNYGLGASATISTAAAWTWAPQRQSWSLFASLSAQKFQGQTPGSSNTWLASGGVRKTVSTHTLLSAELARIQYIMPVIPRADFSQYAIRLSLRWTPLTRERGRLQ